MEILLVIERYLLRLICKTRFARLKCLLIFYFIFHIIFDSLLKTVLLIVHDLELKKFLINELFKLINVLVWINHALWVYFWWAHIILIVLYHISLLLLVNNIELIGKYRHRFVRKLTNTFLKSILDILHSFRQFWKSIELANITVALSLKLRLCISWKIWQSLLFVYTALILFWLNYIFIIFSIYKFSICKTFEWLLVNVVILIHVLKLLIALQT
jgi:hypothetical protein